VKGHALDSLRSVAPAGAIERAVNDVHGAVALLHDEIRAG
jgi:hypothetical protein